MRKITVEPEQLEYCAGRIEDANQNYQRAFAGLFETVDMLKNGWQGKDNIAFSTQIAKFEGDFRQMSVLCAQYSEFLRNSARAYRETQDAIAAQAARLAQ